MPRYFVSEKRKHFLVALVPKGESSKRALAVYKGMVHKGKVVTAKSRKDATTKLKTIRKLGK